MKKIINKICAVTIIGFTISLVTTADAVNPKTANKNLQAQKIDNGPHLTATCHGEPQPCIIRPNAYQSGNSVVFKWSGAGDFYNVRYPVSSGEKQVENRTGHFTFRNIQPNRTYRMSVQACVSRFLSRSSCTNWETSSFTTQ